MVARRLLIVMLLLLGISTLGAALIPSERLERTRTTTATQPPPPDTLPRGERVSATIRIGGRELPVVNLELGQQLLLLVWSKARGDVEIPRLGLTDAVEPLTPARFDLLPTEPGAYRIELVQSSRMGLSSRTVAKIEVAAPANPEPARKKRGRGPPRSRARAEPARSPG